MPTTRSGFYCEHIPILGGNGGGAEEAAAETVL